VRILVVTGSMISAGDRTPLGLLRRQVANWRASSGPWLDLQQKAVWAELLVARELHLRSGGLRRAPYREAVERLLRPRLDPTGVPELTEVVLLGLLSAEGFEVETATYAELSGDPRRREELLGRCPLVFASTTLLRDLSEMRPLIRLVARPHNRVVAGGALVSTLHAQWPGCDGVDLLAVGYGELLVPAIARWIRSGFTDLSPPPTGRVACRSGTPILYSGSPQDRSLDWLPTPDWALAERHHGRAFPLIHYESVRGCPYRCAFCNYPFLFDDTVFRTKSAERIADDWLGYAEQGVEVISCLDSLFTIPPKRLRALCQRLIQAESPLRWLCYARADDLAQGDTAELMHSAGCRVVHIGLESGSQSQLDAMNKRCSVESNARALDRCREVGLTTLTTLIVGYPGETVHTLRETADFLRSHPPDFYFAGGFTTRMESMPVLQPSERRRHGLVTQGDGCSSAPYWRHATMSCADVPEHLRALNAAMIEERVALEGGLFYGTQLEYRASDRAALLDFQHDLLADSPTLRALARGLHSVLGRRLRSDLRKALGPRGAETAGSAASESG
jgi:anaerobic magnesium-protoporphyrin IX monomethyl ester cyclase